MHGEIDTGGPRVLHPNPDCPRSIFVNGKGDLVQPADYEHKNNSNGFTYLHGLSRESWRMHKCHRREWKRRRISKVHSVDHQCQEFGDNNDVVVERISRVFDRLPSVEVEALNHQVQEAPVESLSDPRLRLNEESLEESSQFSSSSKNNRYSSDSNGYIAHQHRHCNKWWVNSCDRSHKFEFNVERRKTKWTLKKQFYLEFVLLLLLIVSGHKKIVKSSLGIASVGTFIGIVGAAPVDLDAGIRAERSANLSHITGASRKIQMYIKNRHLQILPDGTVNGSNDDTSDYTIFQRTSVSRGQLRIQGVATCLYLCMDSCGLLYGSREYTEDCVFNETLEQHNYNTYSSVRWSTARKTLYLGLNRHGQPRRVQARGHNLGRLSAYARVLTQVAPPDRVEALQSHMLGAQHGVRHHHNAHHHRNLQQSVCPTLPPQEKDGRDRFRCRKRKKRKKRKRRCEANEKPGPHCEIYHKDNGQRGKPHSNGDGKPESKRSCEDAASDEFCRRQALDASSKKRKSRIEIVNNKTEDNHHPRRKEIKKKTGKKSTSTDIPRDMKKVSAISDKRRRPVPKRTSNQARRKIPKKSTRTLFPVIQDSSSSPSTSWQITPTTMISSKHQKLSLSPRNAVTSASKIDTSRSAKSLNVEQWRTPDASTTLASSSEDTSLVSSSSPVSEDPLVTTLTSETSGEISDEDTTIDDEETTIDYGTIMTTMDTTPPERTEDYTKATTQSILESLEVSRKLNDDTHVTGIFRRFIIDKLAM